MSCIDLVDIKQSENAAKAGGQNIFTLLPNQTADYTRALYEATASFTKLVEEGDDSFYQLFGKIKVPKRVSQKATYAFERRTGKLKAERLSNLPDSKIRTETGTKFHSVMEDYMNYYANNEGNLTTIRKKAMANIPGLSHSGAIKLQVQAKELYDSFDEIQKGIDPNGKFTVHTEQMATDMVRGIGGTMDVHVIFSDNSDAIIDYKTVGIYNSMLSRDRQNVMSEVINDTKQSDWNLTVGEYKRINKEIYGVNRTRMSRVVLIGVQYDTKEGDVKPGSRLTGKVSRIFTQADSEYLDPRPILEEGKYTGLTKHLAKQNALIETWEERLRTGKLSPSEKEALKARVANARKATNKLILKADIHDTFSSIVHTINTGVKKLNQPEFIKGEEPNPEYATLKDINNIKAELSFYDNIIEEFSTLFADLRENAPETYKEYHTKFKDIAYNVSVVYNIARERAEDVVLNDIPDYAKGVEGELLPQEELSLADRTVHRMSEIQHPVFQAAWKRIQDAQYDTRKSVKATYDIVAKANDGVRKWARNNGMTAQNAFFKIIDKERGELYDRYSQEFRTKIRDAKSSGDVKLLKETFEFKNVEAYKKKHAEKRKSVEQFLTKRQTIEWERKNNLLQSDDAWTNVNLYEDLKYKDSVAKANYSKELKELQKSSNKELLAFYNMYEEQNKLLRELIGIPYGEMPDNFIPNIRKEMIDHVVEDGLFSSFKGKALSEEWWNSLQVREEDAHIASNDSRGNMVRNVPLLYLNKFRSEDGEIDTNMKSYDLAHSLMIFANMAYSYVNMKKIEPTVLGLKALLADPSVREGGTYATDLVGRKIRGKVMEYVTQSKPAGDTVQFFEDVSDFYLYGIRFKENSMSNTVNTTKALLKLKDYYAKKVLSFAVIPGFGALAAGKISTALEASKGTSFSRKDSRTAYNLMRTDLKKFMELPEYLNTFAEEHIERYSVGLSASGTKKLTDTRSLFAPLRYADELITSHVTVAMAQNWGIDEAGKLIKLSRVGINTEGIPTIWDSFVKEGDKYVLNGTNKEVEIAFRAAVRMTVANIIGSLAQDDIAGINTKLLLNLAMQFKSWMPGVVRERFGKLRWEEVLQGFQWGRYRAVSNEILGLEEVRSAASLQKYFNGYVAGQVAKLSLDLVTFGISHKAGIGRVNRDKNKKYYYQWLIRNPQVSKRVDSEELFEEFLATKEGQIRALLIEVRTLAMFIGLMTYLGGNADDGDPRYMSNYATRTIFKLMFKTQTEISFVWNANEFTRMTANPFPLAAILTDFGNTLRNTTDETRDFLFGENSPRDKTPAFYYTMQWAYGGRQLAKLFELFDQNKKPAGM